jgi:hypothetical protein
MQKNENFVCFFDVSKILFLLREWGETTWWPVKRGSFPLPSSGLIFIFPKSHAVWPPTSFFPLPRQSCEEMEMLALAGCRVPTSKNLTLFSVNASAFESASLQI